MPAVKPARPIKNRMTEAVNGPPPPLANSPGLYNENMETNLSQLTLSLILPSISKPNIPNTSTPENPNAFFSSLASEDTKKEIPGDDL
jgi:hypothetical protein